MERGISETVMSSFRWGSAPWSRRPLNLGLWPMLHQFTVDEVGLDEEGPKRRNCVDQLQGVDVVNVENLRLRRAYV